MSEIIFLVHRLPFPPDKGDKIRSYHLLRHLAGRHDVHLGTFIDDVADEKYADQVEALCASARICRLNPLAARVRSLRGLVSGAALSVPYYFDAELASWVEETMARRPIASIVAYSSPMAQYAMGRQFDAVRRTMDFVDVDSDKWQQYAAGARLPMRWVYNRESRYLLEFERQVAAEFDASVFVTDNEVDLFNQLAPDTIAKHHAIANGVATDYFDYELDFANPYPDDSDAIVFTGMMDYWANVDAVRWFAQEIFPHIRERVPRAQFWIVGSSPTREVSALEAIDGVKVTGRVPDVRPYLRHAMFAVAPLRIARGIQNKVLEAMAMGCRVICTTQAATGLEETPEMPIVVEDEEERITEAAIAMAGTKQSPEGRDLARAYVLNNYSWEHNLEQFERIHAGQVD